MLNPNNEMRAIHPGEVLSEEFLVRMDHNQASLCIGISTEELRSLVEGKLDVSDAIAAKLAATFDTTPEFWTNLQAIYDARK